MSTRSRYRTQEESITLSPLEEQIAAQRGGETTELLTLNIGPTIRRHTACCGCS